MKGLVKIKSSHELYAKNHAKIVAAGRMSTMDHRPRTMVYGLWPMVHGPWSLVNTGGQQKIFSFASAYYLNYVFVRKLGSARAE
jgi:hypothetical protein